MTTHLCSFVECAENHYKYGRECIASPVIFIVMLLGGIFVVVGVSIYIYLGYKRKQNDLVWHIQAEELDFNDPPDIIGQGKKFVNNKGRNEQSIDAHGTTNLNVISPGHLRGVRSCYPWTISWNQGSCEARAAAFHQRCW